MDKSFNKITTSEQKKPITADMLNEAAYAIHFRSDLRLHQILYKHGIADLDRVYALAREISEWVAEYMISELKNERARTEDKLALRNLYRNPEITDYQIILYNRNVDEVMRTPIYGIDTQLAPANQEKAEI
jgi:hypothetical protein